MGQGKRKPGWQWDEGDLASHHPHRRHTEWLAKKTRRRGAKYAVSQSREHREGGYVDREPGREAGHLISHGDGAKLQQKSARHVQDRRWDDLIVLGNRGPPRRVKGRPSKTGSRKNRPVRPALNLNHEDSYRDTPYREGSCDEERGLCILCLLSRALASVQ
jgi:hypothetical protein